MSIVCSMATPTILAAMPEDVLSGYKFTSAIAYQDGSVYRLCGAIDAESALAIAKGWIKGAKKSICADVLLRA